MKRCRMAHLRGKITMPFVANDKQGPMSDRDRTKPIGKAVPGLAVIVLACVLLTDLAAAGERPREYDPATCKTDAQGKRYVALGRYVLATPYSKRDAYLLDPLRPGNIGLVPPDPTEPQGCPGNPLQSWSYAFIYAPHGIEADGSANPAGDAPRADRLTLYRTIDRPIPGTEDPEWGGADVLVMSWNTICKLAAVREDLPNGLTACRIKLHWPSDPAAEARQENWGATYRARPDVYTTPLGRPFIVQCGPLLFENTISHCNAGYTIMPGLAVGYRFEPYLGPHPIPIARIIDFDRGLRAAIERIVVKNYEWRGEVSIGKKGE
jgi:hypothetical protein